MSLSLRSSAVLAASLWIACSPFAQSQPPTNNQPLVVTNPQQAGQVNTTSGAIGPVSSPTSPYGGSFNPPPPVMSGPGVAVPGGAGGGGSNNPYTLSTAAGSYNPYLSNSAAMGMGGNPYAMSTMPFPVYPGLWGGWGWGSPGMGLGFALYGNAEQWRAEGQYWKDIQQARQMREQSRQMELDTIRRRVEFEAWYETMRPTTPRVRDREMAVELDRARKDATDTDIASGRVLNTLLASIQKSGSLSRGASIALDQDVLRNINVSGGSSAGNVALLKDGGKLFWPEALQEPAFEESRKRLNDDLRLAVAAVKDREPIPPSRMRDLRGAHKALNDKLAELANELAPSQYVEARRFLNQLGASIRALSDPKVGNYFNSTWQASGRTAAELVANMTKNGLTFAPASPGDEAAYRAVYQALRAFEISLANAGPGITTGN